MNDCLFSESYSEARAKFRQFAELAGAELKEYKHPVSDTLGEPVSIDVATLGSNTSDRVLVILSGVHGVEGFSGSAAQSQALRTFGTDPDLLAGIRLVLIHGVNPVGFATERRANEDNIDLNRNFVDFGLPLPENVAYAELSDDLVPMAADDATFDMATARLMSVVQERGLNVLRDAIQPGQYSHPHGMFYGGTGPAWSRETLEDILSMSLTGSKHVLVLDYHTGLGESGVACLIMNAEEESDPYLRAVNWFPGYKLQGGSAHGPVSAAVSGSVEGAFESRPPDSTLTYVAVEVGTVDMLTVLHALRKDHAANATAKTSGHSGHGEILLQTRKLMRAAFDPASSDWRSMHTALSADLLQKALAALTANVELPPLDEGVGVLVRMMLAESRTPASASYDEADVKKGLQAMKAVVANRLNSPGRFGAPGATTFGQVITAPGQWAGFTRDSAGKISIGTAQSARIDDILAKANLGAPGKFTKFVQNAIEVSAAAVTDPFSGITNIDGTTVLGGCYGWRTAGSGDPGGDFVKIKAGGELAGNQFYAVKPLS